MSVTNPESMRVLRSFISGANAQYRSAGMGDFQMHVHKDGSVTQTHRTAPEFKQPSTTGAAQAQAGASSSGSAAPGSASTSSPSPAPAPSTATRGAPTISDVKKVGADGFALTWSPVAGAAKYGIWQNGVLAGYVTSPSFAGSVATDTKSVLQIDAVTAAGVHSARTGALQVTRAANGAIFFAAAQAQAAAGASVVTTPSAPAR